MDFYLDDGLTGTDDDRPEFQRMIRDMQAGKVNCIVCKNLSRMFRNYSDQGYFLEKVFARYHVRFITVSTPKVDSYLHPETIEGLEVPINGMMNDRFASKTSRDIRDTFATMRRRGEFIGAFAPYGYDKDPTDKNHLIVDERAAVTIRAIFSWFVCDGMSFSGIAKRLNDLEVLSPLAYKRSRGFRLCCPQSKKDNSLWSAYAIKSILKNRMYTGTMVQGKQSVVSYKVHDRVSVPEENWYIVEDTHKPIIDRTLFDRAQSRLQKGDQADFSGREWHLLAGFVRCADCGRAMARHPSGSSVYYYCRTYREKSKRLCTSHSIKEDKLAGVILLSIQKLIALTGAVPKISQIMEHMPSAERRFGQLDPLLQYRQKERDKTIEIIDDLYEEWKEGKISREEYRKLKDRYQFREKQLSNEIEFIQYEGKSRTKECSSRDPYLVIFEKCQNIVSLRRDLLECLVNHINVHEGERLEIEFQFADPYQGVLESLESHEI